MAAAFRLLLCLLLCTAAAEVRAEGAAYVVRSPSTGLYERPNVSEPTHTLIRGQVITVLQKRGEWLRIITEDGDEGWVRDSTVNAIPSGEEEEESRIRESAPDDVPDMVYHEVVVGSRRGNIRSAPQVDAPIVRTAEEGEVLTIIVEEGEWYQVGPGGNVEGWMHRSVGERRESRNLTLRILDLVEGRLAWFDQFKNETPGFRRMGWFPSFFLEKGERDLAVRPFGGGGSEVVIDLSYARREIEHRTIIAGADRFYLPSATRTFLADLLLSVLESSAEVRAVTVRLWFAALGEGGRLSWETRGELELRREAASRLPKEGGYTGPVWSALSRNTVPGELWNP